MESFGLSRGEEKIVQSPNIEATNPVKTVPKRSEDWNG